MTVPLAHDVDRWQRVYRGLEIDESLQAGVIADALHAEVSGTVDSPDSTDWDALPLARQRTYREAADLAVRHLSAPWRDMAHRRAAAALAEHLDDIKDRLNGATLVIGRALTPEETAERVASFARDIVAAYVDTLTGMDPLTSAEQVALMQAREKRKDNDRQQLLADDRRRFHDEEFD